MKKLVIVCGGNKCGKTTLVNKIINYNKDIKWEYIKCSQPQIVNGVNQAFKQYNDILDNINKDKNYIIDRFHFGSFVYGPIYRGISDFSVEQFDQLEKKIIQNNYIFILALANKLWMEEKFVLEKEEYARFDLIDKEIELYNEIKLKSSLNIIEHSLPYNDMTDKIISYIFKD